MSSAIAERTLQEEGRAPSLRARILVALLVGIASAAFVASLHIRDVIPWSDFDPLWVAARALLAGADPYEAVSAMEFPFPLYYPLPAVLVDVPFALLPRALGRAAFAGTTAALLAFAATARAWWPLLFLTSAPFLHALMWAQWSPALTAAVLVPALGALFVVKPSTGLVLFATRPTRTAVIGGAALLALGFLVRPDWLVSWFDAARQVTHIAPILRPGGVLLLLALLRWRRPEGRLLTALALVPTRPVHYELLPLLVLVPRSLREAFLLIIGADIAFVLTTLIPLASDQDAVDASWWPMLLVFVYVPALVLVMLRPNRAEPLAVLRPSR